MNGEMVSSSPCTTPRKLKFEQLRADYELFLQTFEKPSWTYRLLHRRHQLSPFMLHRNLSYLKGRSPTIRKEKQQVKRRYFKVNSLLDRLEIKETEDEHDDCENKKHYLNLSFGGFFHGPGFAEEMFQTNDPKLQSIFKDDFVHVSLDLIQVFHKRKKDRDVPLETKHLGQCKAPWNPRTQLLLPGSSVQLTVPPSVFKEGNKSIKTHILSFTVSLKVPKKKRKKKLGRKKQDINGNSDNTEATEPPAKRVKSYHNDEENESEQDNIVEKTSTSLTAELILYDRHRTCLLTDGDYELLLNLNEESAFGQRSTNTFESKFENKLGPFTAFSFGPALKFNLQWSNTPNVPMISSIYKSLEDPYINKTQPLEDSLSNVSNQQELVLRKNMVKLPKVFYQFIYSNSTRQQTEAKEGTFCPWCNLNCATIYGLLRHLKCCHLRFSIMYTALRKGHRIDICVNESFDSTLGFDGIKDVGFIDIDNAPVKRRPKTEVLVGRPLKHNEDLKEFMEPDSEEYEGSIPLKGHQRTYFHSANNQHVSQLNEFDLNSEDERAPDWLQEKTQNMIEEFTDVNHGEKMLMKMWNTHVLKNGYVADFTAASGCESFVDEYGMVLIKRGLVRNFLVHLNNLLEFQIVSQSQIVSAMDRLTRLQTAVNVG